MKTKVKAMILVAAITVFLLVWAPWITDDYAINKVIESLGGPETSFNYLGGEMLVKDIPKKVVWLPFVRAIYFPSEAVWFVTFYGAFIF